MYSRNPRLLDGAEGVRRFREDLRLDPGAIPDTRVFQYPGQMATDPLDCPPSPFQLAPPRLSTTLIEYLNQTNLFIYSFISHQKDPFTEDL